MWILARQRAWHLHAHVSRQVLLMESARGRKLLAVAHAQECRDLLEQAFGSWAIRYECALLGPPAPDQIADLGQMGLDAVWPFRQSFSAPERVGADLLGGSCGGDKLPKGRSRVFLSC